MNCLISSLSKEVAKNGKPYLKISAITEEKKNVTLYLWNNLEDFIEKNKDFRVFNVEANFNDQFPEISSYDGKGDIPLTNFVEFVYPNDEYANKLLDKMISTISEPVFVDLLKEIFTEDVRKKFITWPAAEGYHHNYKYGLLQHSFEVVSFTSSITKNDYFSKVNREIALTGALLHDIGKINEYAFDGLTAISRARGMYISSHNSSGAEMVAVAFNNMQRKKDYTEKDAELIEAVKHIIRAHHYQKEWNSVCKPATLEAYLVFVADFYSAAYNKGENVVFDQEDPTVGFTNKKEVFVKFD